MSSFCGAVFFTTNSGGLNEPNAASACDFCAATRDFAETVNLPPFSRRARSSPPISITDACVLPQTIASASRPSNFVRWNSPRKCSSCIDVFFKVSESGNCGYDQ